MSAVAIDEAARKWVGDLETRERLRHGVNATDARWNVARRMGVQPGTLENVRRGRMKAMSAWVYERIRGAIIRELQNEIARLQHEKEIAMALGLRADQDEVREVEAHLAAAKELIQGAGK